MAERNQPPRYSGSSPPPIYEQSEAQARASGQTGREQGQAAADENASVVSYDSHGQVNVSREARRVWAETRLTMTLAAAATPSQAPIDYPTPGWNEARLTRQQNAHERALQTARTVLREQGQPSSTQASQPASDSAAGSTTRDEGTEQTEGSERASDTVRLFMGERGIYPSQQPDK